MTAAVADIEVGTVTTRWHFRSEYDRDLYHLYCVRYHINQRDDNGEPITNRSEYLTPDGAWVPSEQGEFIAPCVSIPGPLAWAIVNGTGGSRFEDTLRKLLVAVVRDITAGTPLEASSE